MSMKPRYSQELLLQPAQATGRQLAHAAGHLMGRLPPSAWRAEPSPAEAWKHEVDSCAHAMRLLTEVYSGSSDRLLG